MDKRVQRHHLMVQLTEAFRFRALQVDKDGRTSNYMFLRKKLTLHYMRN